MSSVCIRNFINTYNYIYKSGISVKNIKQFPYPKYPINTDKLIKEYQNEVDTFIRTGKVKNPNNFNFEKVKKDFPKEYFNYSSK